VEHLLHAGVTDRDQCELGGDEEAIRQDQHADRYALEQKETVHLAVRIAFLKDGIVSRQALDDANCDYLAALTKRDSSKAQISVDTAKLKQAHAQVELLELRSVSVCCSGPDALSACGQWPGLQG
jgi:multidrug resistance efflux pump